MTKLRGWSPLAACALVIVGAACSPGDPATAAPVTATAPTTTVATQAASTQPPTSVAATVTTTPVVSTMPPSSTTTATTDPVAGSVDLIDASEIAARWGTAGPSVPSSPSGGFGSGCEFSGNTLPDGVWHVTVESITDVLMIVTVNCYYGDDWQKRHELGDPLCRLDESGTASCDLDDYAVEPIRPVESFYAPELTWFFFEPGPAFVVEAVLTGIPDDIERWLADPYGGDAVRPGWVLVENGEVVEWMDASGRYA